MGDPVMEAMDRFMKAIHKPMIDMLNEIEPHVERTPEIGGVFLLGKLVNNWNSFDVCEDTVETRKNYAIAKTMNDPLFATVVGHALQQMGRGGINLGP